MEQERNPRPAAGAGYRLAAPALRARQRSLGQSALDFDDAAWDRAERDPALEAEAGLWPQSVRGLARLPWADCLAILRRGTVIGLMGAAGFGVVLYASRPRPIEKTQMAARVVTPDAAETTMAQNAAHSPAALAPATIEAAPTPAPAPAVAETAPSAARIADPAPAAVAAGQAGTGQATNIATDSANSVTAQSPAFEAAGPLPAPDTKLTAIVHPAPAPVTAASRGAGKIHAKPVRVAAHPVVTLASLHEKARAPRRAAGNVAALPGWLTVARQNRPRVLIMSERPHDLVPPPGAEREVVASLQPPAPSWSLPALRTPAMARFPAAPPPPVYWRPPSSVYFGPGYLPPPMPDRYGD